MAKLFRSKQLIDAYDRGAMGNIKSRFQKYVTQQNILGIGGDATAFNYKKNKVFKICNKKIDYFANFVEHKTCYEFAAHINYLGSCFLPVIKVLHDEPDFMVYTQRKCKMLDVNMITKGNMKDIFRGIVFMINHKIITNDIGAHNWGIIDNKAYIIDYHGLSKLKMDGDKITDITWWDKVARNLTRYMSRIYTPDQRKQIKNHILKYDTNCINYLRKSKIPQSFVDILEYMRATPSQTTSYIRLCELFNTCMTHL